MIFLLLCLWWFVGLSTCKSSVLHIWNFVSFQTLFEGILVISRVQILQSLLRIHFHYSCTIMAEVAEVKPCSNPGCDQHGTKSCSACKTTFYCCVICQTADWTNHKEECDGHLRKVGMANLVKAKRFHDEQNYVQELRYADLATTKMNQNEGSSSWNCWTHQWCTDVQIQCSESFGPM